MSAQPPPVSGSDADPDRAQRGRLREREAEELANAAAALRAAAARLPRHSSIGRDLEAWAGRLAFAAQVHGLLDDSDDEEPGSG